MKQTSNQKAEPENESPMTTYQKVVFYIAFALIALESLVLIFAPSLENVVPILSQEIIDNRAQLLSVAAAITMVLALLMVWKPKGFAWFATLGSGVLSFSAACISIEMEQLSTGLALLAMVFPFWITMLPALQWTENKSDWATIVSSVGFITLANQAVILGIKPLTEIAVFSGIHTPMGIIMTSVLMAILFTASILVLQSIVKLLKTTKVNLWFCNIIQRTPHFRRKATRSELRRKNRKTKKD